MSHRKAFTYIAIGFIISIVLYMTLVLIGARSTTAVKIILSYRYPKLIAIVVAGIIISITSLLFQTITQNRILTPNMLGFDTIFVAIQTIIVYYFSNISILNNSIVNFIFSVVVMVVVTLTMYKTVLNKSNNNIIILLLIGLVITTFINSFISFIQSLMSPEEFFNLANKTTVSLSNITEELLIIAVPLLIIIMYLIFKDSKKYEIISLGEDNAKNLGLDYVKEVNKNLVYIAFAMSIATALVGPLSFLGLISVNITRESLKTNNHRLLMIFSSMVSVIFILVSSMILDFTGMNITISMVINLLGGAYLIYLILKENKI